MDLCVVWGKDLLHNPDFQQRLRKNTFKNIEGKEESTGNQHVIFLIQCFLLYLRQPAHLQPRLICRVQIGV